MPDVYCRRLDGPPTAASDPADAFSAAVREWIGNRWPAGRDWFDLLEPSGFRTDDGALFRWEPYVEAGRTLIDFTFRHPDSDDPRVSWVSTATLVALPERTSITVKVSNTWQPALGSSPKMTTRPRLLMYLARQFRLAGVEGPLALECHRLEERDVPFFVSHELFDPHRKYPILAVTPCENGGFIIDPDQIASEFLSLAKLFVLATPRSTFALTDELHRRELSVFRGAARLYNPGFDFGSDPYQHPLILPHRLSVADARRSIAEVLAIGTLRYFQADQAVPILRDERAVVVEQKRRAAFDALSRRSESDVQDWQSIAQTYADANEDLEARLAETEQRLREYESKIAALEYALTQRARPVSPEDETARQVLEPHSVLEAVEIAAELYGDKITLLDSAFEAARISPYKRLDELSRVLAVVADVSARLRSGPLGQPLEDELKARGVDYRGGVTRNTSKKTRKQFRFDDGGREVACEEHIALGGGTYAPEDCLRIYLHSEVGRGIIVGHVGRHLDTDRTT